MPGAVPRSSEAPVPPVDGPVGPGRSLGVEGRDGAWLRAIVARRFHLDGATKSDIAIEFGLSRFKVARLLDEALADGTVRISVSFPVEVDAELSSALAERFALEAAWVVRSGPDDDGTRDAVARCAAGVLAGSLGPGEVLGLSWGRELAALVDALPPLPSLEVVQVAGALSADLRWADAVELVRAVARRARGRAHVLHAPMVVADAETAARLRSEAEVAETMANFGRLTTLVTGVGTWEGAGSPIEIALGTAEAARLRRAGVVADLGACLLRADGTVVEDRVLERMVTIGPREIARVPRVVAVGSGAAKGAAIAAAATSGLVHSIVTDSAAAMRAFGSVPARRP